MCRDVFSSETIRDKTRLFYCLALCTKDLVQIHSSPISTHLPLYPHISPSIPSSPIYPLSQYLSTSLRIYPYLSRCTLSRDITTGMTYLRLMLTTKACDVACLLVLYRAFSVYLVHSRLTTRTEYQCTMR